METTVSLIIIIICLCAFLYGIIRKAIIQKKEIILLKEEISAEKEKTGYLMKHIDEIAKIKNDEISISQKIEGAKTDEEISNIVSAIISANNSRVQNYKAKKQN